MKVLTWMAFTLRYYEINAFVPEQFWRLRLTHKVEDVTTEFNWERRRLFKRDVVEVCVSLLCRLK